jgi:hypothetical protein
MAAGQKIWIVAKTTHTSACSGGGDEYELVINLKTA